VVHCIQNTTTKDDFKTDFKTDKIEKKQRQDASSVTIVQQINSQMSFETEKCDLLQPRGLKTCQNRKVQLNCEIAFAAKRMILKLH